MSGECFYEYGYTGLAYGAVREWCLRAGQLIYGDNLTTLETNDTFWKPANGPPTAVVTGANTGLGYSTALYLACHGWDVILACRNKNRGEKAVAQIKKSLKTVDQKGSVTFEQLDLADLSSIAEFVERYKRSKRPLHVLFNNAGLCLMDRTFTKDGFETIFGVCQIGTHTLTKKLIPTLQASQPSRVINTSSAGHLIADWQWDDMQYERRSWDPMAQYGNAKLANVLHAIEGEKRYGASGVHFYSAHPGGVSTDFFRNYPTFPGRDMLISMLKSSDNGARTQLYCGLAPSDELVGGGYYADTVVGQPRSQQSRDPDLAASLWTWTDAQLKSKGH
eukprot:Clim_evm3s230 gene=Clim_evmTU3s230